MRVLDLGCHDGYIASWIGRQFTDVHVDGIDANSHAVAEFNRRHEKYGISGQAYVGLAEDAPDIFEPGTYDAVIAFELIEHVPDIDAFLMACEIMLKEEGRVYLSTPNGTFGAGQNPHHLRALRIIELIDIVRRRGTVTEAIPGPDGVSFVSYVPENNAGTNTRGGPPKPTVDIYTGPAWKAWHPIHAEMPGGLGGSETAAFRLGEALTKEGWVVTIYGEFEEQGMWKQVMLRHHSVYDPMADRDVLIASRAPWIADARPRARWANLLWMHDTDYGPNLTQERGEFFDRVLVLSEWHTRHVEAEYPFLAGRTSIVRNGIEPSYFKGPALMKAIAEREDHSVIYTSSPDRGLDLLLELWPEVLFHLPDAKLRYCYADVYQAVAQSRPEVAAHLAKINHLAEDLGDSVENLGALAQDELALAMARSGVWAHPSWNTPHNMLFFETFCIGAVESGLAGCRRVMASWGALTERSTMPPSQGLMVTHSPADDIEAYRSEWAEALVEAMTVNDPEGRPYPGVSPYSWHEVVKRDFLPLMREPGFTYEHVKFKAEPGTQLVAAED